MPGSYSWSSLDGDDGVKLRDSASGRATVLRRPPAELLGMDEIIRIEALAFRDSDRPQAELFGSLDSDPLRVLSAMNWLIAFWAVLWDLRAAEPARDLVGGLDYGGPWRTGSIPEREQVWRSLSDRVRAGVMAALTGDPAAHRTYAEEVRRLAPDVFLHVTLTIMDDLNRELTARGLELCGMAAALAERTTAPARARPSFIPPWAE